MLNKLKKIVLENKFEIYHIPANLGSDVISVDLFYKVGSRNEVMGKSGIAHMLEHMNFKSTKNHKAGEFDKIVKAFGGINNASTGFDYTHYFIKCANSNLEKSVELLADMMENLKLDDAEFQPERDVVAEERRWRTDNDPFGFLYFRLFNEAYTYHPYHWTPIGFMDDILNWDIEDIRDFHETYYQPQNAFLVIAGDIDEKKAFQIGKKYFNHIKNKKALPKFYFKEPKQNGEKLSIIKKTSDVDIVTISYKIPPFNHEDIIALSALGDYLGSGKSSVLTKTLVDEKKLANEVEAFSMDLKDEGLFIIMAICNPDSNPYEIKEEIEILIEKIKNEEIPSKDLEKIKNSLKSSLVYSKASASSLANLFGSYIARGDLKPLENLEENTAKLKSQDLQEVAKKYLINDSKCSIILKGLK